MKKLKYSNRHAVREKDNRVLRPLVSIITVCRNSEATIAKTIESVLNQTYHSIEYLIIDGISTDNTMKIVKKYEPKFQGRLYWISEKDSGIYDAMNKGIDLAKGDIIGIINSDDWYEAESVQYIADSYHENGDAVYYGILRVMERGEEVMLKSTNPRYLFRDVVGHPAYFISKSIYNKYGSYNLEYKMASDYDLIMRLIQHRVPFIQINSILANFSTGGQSEVSVKTTVEEYLKIRYKYGYISKVDYYKRLLVSKLGSLIRRVL